MDLVVRPATEQDIPAVQAIARRTWADAYRDVIPEDAQSRILDRAYSRESLLISIRRGQAFLVAETGGAATATESSCSSSAPADLRPTPDSRRLAGFVDVVFDGTGFTLHRIYVLPEYQRLGAGCKLLASAVAALFPGFVPPSERWADRQPVAIRAAARPAVKAAEIVETAEALEAAKASDASEVAETAGIADGPTSARPRDTYVLTAHVERDNPGARAFYRKMGFAEGKEEIVVIGGISLPVIRITIVVGNSREGSLRDVSEDHPCSR